MKTMKNIKPAYAVQLGKGVFAGSVIYKFMCTKCGTQTPFLSFFPDPKYYGKCPDTKSGNHTWKKVDTHTY